MVPPLGGGCRGVAQGDDGLGGGHPRKEGMINPLHPRPVQKSRRITQQKSSGESGEGEGLDPPFDQNSGPRFRWRSSGQPFLQERMRLEALQQGHGIGHGVGVIEIDHQSHIQTPFLAVIDEAAAVVAMSQGPADNMFHGSGVRLFGGNVPDLFDTQGEMLRGFSPIQMKVPDQDTGEMPSGPFGNQGDGGGQLHPGLKIGQWFSLGISPHISGDDTT